VAHHGTGSDASHGSLAGPHRPRARAIFVGIPAIPCEIQWDGPLDGTAILRQ
jgi:hypothetical protein